MFDERMRRLCLVLGGLLALVLGRAFQLQVVEAHERLQEHTRTRSPFSTVVPRRGDILFSDGTPMVANDSRYTVHVECAAFRATQRACRSCGERVTAKVAPKSCGECGGSAFVVLPGPDLGELARILGTTRETLAACFLEAERASAKSSYRTWRLLDAKISRDTARELALRAADFPGISVTAERVRLVEECARRIVGRARPPHREEMDALTDPEREGRGETVLSRQEARMVLVGSSGLERTYDDALRGVPGRIVRLHGRPGQPPPPPLVEREVVDGSPLRTTIDRTVQEVAHRVVAGTKGTAAVALVLDLRDGAIVAADWKSDDGLNHAVARILPGSVLKLATALALLESGIDPLATLDCEKKGMLRRGVPYTCTGTHPGADLLAAFAGSCNLYFMHRAEDVGGPALLDAYRRLGLFHEGDVGFAHLPPSKVARSSHDELRFLGIGQGAVAVTPVHVAVAYARVATGGRTIVPYLDAGRGPDALSAGTEPVIQRHASLLQEAARRVVTNGTARSVMPLRDADVAGKSGTAEVDLPRGPQDPPGFRRRTKNAWFVGFAPSVAPRFVAVVVHEHVEEHGGEMSGPDVAELLRAALR